MKDDHMNANIITTPFLRTAALGAVLLAATACASVPNNSGIADAQSRLTSAYNDKETAERGQGDLANAKASLLTAQNEWKSGRKKEAGHHLLMGQTYLDLAETRGQQARLEAENVALEGRARLADVNRVVASRDKQIAGQTQQMAAKDAQLSETARKLAEAREQLRQSDMKTTDLGATMVLQDVSFETGKSVLLSGGVNRLAPLLNFLRLAPEAKVSIEGNTDNVGGAAYNQRLSLDRANAVKAILTAGGVGPDRISTSGAGFDKPLATNDTNAGRQLNRRVEITLLEKPAQ
jgi:outer membrane protein OmpA-like peptidoglycan-associated protein